MADRTSRMDKSARIVIAGAGQSQSYEKKQKCEIYLTSCKGMGGLAAALALAKKGFTSIDVYETASNLGFVGAGIQLAPNMARILDRLGVWDDIAREAVDCLETSIRRKLTVSGA